ncbi:MAG: hypothetical protein IT449_07225 [Phycisphaerales bacterium]|nr:hypothetical protein [Phycisphaerales bacterium]
MSQQFQAGPRVKLTEPERIAVLIEEYRALYQLLLFRLRAIDQRVPAAGGMLGIVLGSVPALPPETQLLFLAGIPSCLAWIVATTLGHARSKEDHLRRIDEIERLVNRIAGEELLVFQSQHPNRKASTAGRTGTAAMFAVGASCLTALAACIVLFHSRVLVDPQLAIAYDAYVGGTAAYLVHAVAALRRYRYQRPPAPPAPPFAAFRTD